jgi:hypothetical protein
MVVLSPLLKTCLPLRNGNQQAWIDNRQTQLREKPTHLASAADNTIRD